MSIYVVADMKNFQLFGEYSTKKLAEKSCEWGYSVCTLNQFYAAEKAAWETAKSICDVCGKTFFPESDWLEDSICSSCKVTKPRESSNFLLDHAAGG